MKRMMSMVTVVVVMAVMMLVIAMPALAFHTLRSAANPALRVAPGSSGRLRPRRGNRS